MTFGAPIGREVKLLTAFALATILVPIGLQLSRGFWLLPLVLTTILTVIVTQCVRGYELGPGELRIRRLLWHTSWPIDRDTTATVRPHAMKGSWRTWGNGGVFAITGRFSGSGLGRFRAFVTDPARTVVITTRHGIVVISPDRPEAFVAAINADRQRRA